MTLKHIVIGAFLLFIFAVLSLNTWFLSRLTEDVSAQLGRSAFEITKDTVEAMLSIQFEQDLMLYNRSLDSNTSEFEHSESSQRVTPLAALENSIDLKLSDGKLSQSIILVQNNQEFPIAIPRSAVDKSLVEVKQHVWYSGMFLLVASTLFVLLFINRLTSPLKSISSTSFKIGAGQFGAKVPAKPKPIGKEIHQLVESINTMSAQLLAGESAKQQLKEQQSIQEISELVRGMAHSIRNPLHTISLSLDLETHTDEQKQHFCDIVRTQIERIDQHLKNLMTITSHSSLTTESTDLNQLVNEVVEQNSSNQSDKAIIISGRFNSPCNAVKSELQSVLEVLVSNALDVTPVKGKVLIECDHSDDRFALSVIDHGPGLDQQRHEHLFKPHNTSKTYGSGMGLYIASKMIRGRYAGNILYQHSSQSGTRFVVQFGHRVNP